MTTNLWTANHPRNFWQCRPDPPDEAWQAAIAEALPVLGLDLTQPDIDAILALTLGEGRFGPGHWTLSLPKRAYYVLKPLLPRTLTRLMRRAYSRASQPQTEAHWPIDERYVSFLWAVLAGILRHSAGGKIEIKALWPENKRFALVLTHDVESQAGLQFIPQVADLEQGLGFRSSFHFVAEDYPIDMALVDELRRRGFEVGIHGLKHDGKLCNSRAGFEHCAAAINQHLKRLDAHGFRSPLTLRNPEWMQALDVSYDLSFFDTDPFEPIPGGSMSIWPFLIGHFVELPYTLVQDYTLTDVLKQDSPRIWLEKVEFIREHWGMALLNSHPDYLKAPFRLEIYSAFLKAMRDRDDCWNALPGEVARWWRERPSSGWMGTAELDDGEVHISSEEAELAPLA